MTKLTQPGNSKLGATTHMFNLPASHAVCGRACKGCYAMREQTRFPTVLRARESRYQASLQPNFAQRIIAELKAKRKLPAYFRVHASGEFYSQQYIDSWHTIASAFPSVTFYAYTKRKSDFDFTSLSSLPNFILIDSLHFGRLNYGKLGTEPANAFVCPTGTDSLIQCGVSCSYCMTKEAQHNGVYFIQH